MEENCTPGINDIINVQEWSKGTHPASVAAEAPGPKVTTTSTFHVRCPTPQAGLTKMSRIMKEELLVWWKISLGTLSVCWEPLFLSDIHAGEKLVAASLHLRSTERNVRGPAPMASWVSSAVWGTHQTGVWSTRDSSKGEKLWLAQRVGTARWPWDTRPELLGQECVFLVDEGWALPTTELVWGHWHACSKTLGGGADVLWGPFRGPRQKTSAGRGQVCSGSAVIWGKEGCKWTQQGNCRWEPPELGSLSRPQEMFSGERRSKRRECWHQIVAGRPQPCLPCLPTFPPSSTHWDPERDRDRWRVQNAATAPFLSEGFLPEAGLGEESEKILF